MRSNLNRSKSQASSSSSSSVSSVSSPSKGTSTTKEDASSIDDSRINKSTNTVEYHLAPSNKWVACDAATTAATATTYAKELAKYRKSLYAKLKIQSVKARTYDVSLHPCHQCNRKKQHFLTCTKCHSVYCSKCLHDSGYEKGSGYVSQNSYVCPLCRKICKCAKCQAKDDGKPKARTRSRDPKSSDKGTTTSKEKGKQSDSEWYYDVDEIEEIKNDGESEDDEDAADAAEADTSADYVEEGDPEDDSDEELSDFSEGDEEEDEEDEEVDDESNKTTEERAESKKKIVSNKQNSGGARRTDTRRNFRQPRHRDFSNDEIITPGIGVCIPKKVDIKIEVPPWRLIEESMYEGVEEESFDDSDEYYISIHEKMSRILDKENSKFIEPLYKKRRIAQPPRKPKVAEVKTGQSNGIKNEKSASHVNTRKKQQRPSRSYTSSDFIFDDETGLLGLNNGGNDDNDDGGKDIEGVHQRRYPQRKREPVQKGTKKTPSATPAAVASASTSATRVQPARRIKAPTIALPKSVLNRKQQPHGALFGKSATSAAKTEKKPEKEKVEEKKAAVVNGGKKEADSSSNEESGVRDVKHNESDEKHNKPKEVKKSAVPSFLSMDTSKTTNRTTTSQNDSIYTKMYNKIGSIVINAITSATPGMSSSSSSSSSLQSKQKQPQQIIQKQQQSINQNQQIQSKNQIIQPQQINQQQQQQQPQQQFQQFQPTLQLPSYQPMQSSYYNQQLPYQQYSLPQSQPSQVGSLPVNNYTTFKNSNYNTQNNFGYGNYPQTSYQPSNRLYSSQQQVHNQQSMGPQYGGQQYENPWGSRQTPAYPNYRYAQEMCALCRVQEPSMMCPTCSAKLCSQRCYEVHYKNEHYFKYR